MLIRHAEVSGTRPLDVRVVDGVITAIAPALDAESGERVLYAAGGALLPGLHDHHLHLFALARAADSVSCGPPDVSTVAQLEDALVRSSAADVGSDPWIRGIAYHESVAGDLDRDRLDVWLPERPARVQHRSGALWILNSAGLAAIGVRAESETPPGVERDAAGRPTGRLFRLDAWLRERMGSSPPPDLTAVGRRLAEFGVTGLTDATVSNGNTELAALVDAVNRRALPQRLVVMGTRELGVPDHPDIERGAVKIVLAETELPTFDELVAEIASAHAAERPVAIHCVARSELILAAGALAAALVHPGDRIEHAAVAPPESLELVKSLSVTVVTQPNFVRERGDAYRVDVTPRDRSWLYRCRAFLEAGIPVGGGTDAPFGDPDPWAAMRAAVDRRTLGGAELGRDERITPEQALALFTTTAQAPGGAVRRVAAGERADLCLLDRPWADARETLDASHVIATFRDGVSIGAS